MNQHYAESRKIDPARRGTRPDGSPADNDRAEIGPTPLAFAEWAEAGIEVPDLARMRAERHARLVKGINDRGLGGALLFDPLNIRFATDSSNMQVWNAHNPFRACFVGADGHMVIFDFKGGPDKMLSDFNPLVKEVRAGAGMFYFSAGDLGDARAHEFTGQIGGELMAAHGHGKRLAVDKIMVAGYRALTAANFEVIDGEELTEKVRAVKGADEIRGLRCATHSCERSVAAMEAAAAAGHDRGRCLGRAARREHPARRRVDRVPPARLGPAHEPLVPGMRAARHPERRDPGLRHRPGRAIRHVRRHQPDLVDRRRRADARDEAPLTASRTSTSSRTPRC